MAPKQTIRVLDNDQGYITLLDHMGSEVDIVNAARVSYDKYTDTMHEKDGQQWRRRRRRQCVHNRWLGDAGGPRAALSSKTAQ